MSDMPSIPAEGNRRRDSSFQPRADMDVENEESAMERKEDIAKVRFHIANLSARRHGAEQAKLGEGEPGFNLETAVDRFAHHASDWVDEHLAPYARSPTG